MRKKHPRFAFLKRFLLLTLFVYGTIVIFPRTQSFVGDNPLRVMANQPPLLIAHGGGNLEFPDNTLEAYYHAYAVNPNVMLETDVNITKDNVIILSHDRTLDRKTNVTNATISELNYTDLVANEVDFGYSNPTDGPNGFNITNTFRRYQNYLGEEVSPLDVTYPEGIVARHPTKFLVSTLESLITLFPHNLINVEIKQTGDIGLRALDSVIELMDTYAQSHDTYQRIVLASFHENVYEKLQELQETTHPDLMFSPEFNGVLSFYIMQLTRTSIFYDHKVAVLQLPTEQLGLSLTTRSLIQTAHQHNIAVHYWTINDEATMIDLIEKGVDGIMTDRPTLLQNVLDRYATT
jgi:glycerophosphoryl diester phosphodiesterase